LLETCDSLFDSQPKRQRRFTGGLHRYEWRQCAIGADGLLEAVRYERRQCAIGADGLLEAVRYERRQCAEGAPPFRHHPRKELGDSRILFKRT
jgi:hypothetical protein